MCRKSTSDLAVSKTYKQGQVSNTGSELRQRAQQKIPTHYSQLVKCLNTTGINSARLTMSITRTKQNTVLNSKYIGD